MMPSRGIQLARGHAPRLFQQQCRNLSLASRRFPSPPSRNALQSQSLTSAWRPHRSVVASSVPALRHASSAPSSAPSTASSPPPSTIDSASPTSAAPDSFPNLDTISIDGIELDSLANVPERLGYLHEIGVNYGYGITSSIQWVIEHLHISAGLPWWGSIATAAVLMRLALLPLYLKSSDVMARTAAMNSVTKPISDRMQECKVNKDSDGMRAAYMELVAVRKSAGISTTKQLTPLVCQAVLAYCGFRLVRTMASLPVPAFVTEGPLWLQDLTVSDPYLILPIAMAGTLHVLARMGGETGAASTNVMTPGMKNMMLYGLPTLVVVFMGFQPAALCIWFCASGFVGISQSLLLKRPAIRQFFGIAPLYTPPKGETAPSIMDVIWPKAKPTATPQRPAATSMGKNAAYMNPVYQSPKLNRSSSSRTVIDVKATTKSHRPQPAAASSAAAESDMVQANRPRQGVVDEVSKAWNNLGQQKKPQSGRKKPSKGR